MSSETRDLMIVYAATVITLLAKHLGPFLERVTMESTMGWRQHPDIALDPSELKTMTFEYASQRLDKSGHPMFVEEIQGWVKMLRFVCGHPTEAMKGLEVFNTPLEDQFCHEELLAFCAWLETQERGAGLTLYIGPLKPGINVK